MQRVRIVDVCIDPLVEKVELATLQVLIVLKVELQWPGRRLAARDVEGAAIIGACYSGNADDRLWTGRVRAEPRGA